MVKPKDELTIDEIRSLAGNSPFLSWVHFIGGEPTDREDFPEIARAFSDSCPNLLAMNFPTNGLKPKRIEEQVREMTKLGVPKFGVTVSIDGPPELNDRLRGIPRDFERAVETFQRLDRIRGVSVFVGMTLYDSNVALIDETVRELQRRIPGFSERRLHLNLPHFSPHYYENAGKQLKVSMEMADAVRVHQQKKGIPRSGAELIEWLYQRQVEPYVRTGSSAIECSALYASLYLSERGEVYPCSIWDHPLGNIRDTGLSFVPILARESTQRTRDLVIKKECPDCWTPCEAYQSILVSQKIGALATPSRSSTEAKAAAA